MNDNKTYYEKFDWEKANLASQLTEKINSIVNTIPNDVNSIIDIGCGDGSITNKLNDNYKVVAIDRSRNALQYVKSHRIQASADYLPIKSSSADMVFSSEMLEHLPEDIFNNTIIEFKRISKRYIFLTFPNDENIKKNFVHCSNCGFEFNKSYHLRTLNKKIIEKLFPDYSIKHSFYTGSLIRPYKKILSDLKHKYSPFTSWIPPHWTPDNRRKTMCPNCNTTFDIPYKFNSLSFFLDSINSLISPKRPYQICILLEKKND
ncbi:MAG: hypothetical protein OHK0036_20750 [Bacteroidia bacterium]